MQTTQIKKSSWHWRLLKQVSRYTDSEPPFDSCTYWRTLVLNTIGHGAALLTFGVIVIVIGLFLISPALVLGFKLFHINVDRFIPMSLAAAGIWLFGGMAWLWRKGFRWINNLGNKEPQYSAWDSFKDTASNRLCGRIQIID